MKSNATSKQTAKSRSRKLRIFMAAVVLLLQPMMDCTKKIEPSARKLRAVLSFVYSMPVVSFLPAKRNGASPVQAATRRVCCGRMESRITNSVLDDVHGSYACELTAVSKRQAGDNITNLLGWFHSKNIFTSKIGADRTHTSLAGLTHTAYF